MGTDNEVSQFFSKLVLCTEHDEVSPYTHLVTDILLKISQQSGEVTNQPKVNIYCKWVQFLRPKGERVWMHTVINGGAILNTLCTSKWKTQKDRLTRLSPSRIVLSVADNHRIPSKG